MARQAGKWWLRTLGVTVVAVVLGAVLLAALPGRTGAGATGNAARQQPVPPGRGGLAIRPTTVAPGGSPSASHPSAVSSKRRSLPSRPTDGTGLTIVGDSLTDGPRMWIEEALPAAVIRAKGYEKWAWGMAQLPELRAEGRLRPALAFLMGTNFGVTNTDVDNLIAAAPEARTFILMTVHVPARFQQIYGAQTNAVVTSAAARHPEVTIKVEDWNAYATAHPHLLGPDGIHPTPQGAVPLAQLLRATAYDLPMDSGSGG